MTDHRNESSRILVIGDVEKRRTLTFGVVDDVDIAFNSTRLKLQPFLDIIHVCHL
jgi:hypothetical protein